MSNELKPCPFCGSEPRERRQMDESHYSHAAVEFLQIHCDECDASSVCSEDHDAVLTAWNSRASLAQTGAEPVAWRITDGEGGYHYSEDDPELFDVDWSARYGRKFEPLYAAPTAPAPLPAPTWECKAGGLKPLTDAQYQAQREKIQRHYTRVAAPLPAREPLTDEQIDTEIAVHVDPVATYHRLLKFARAIEAAHGITATPADKEQP